MDFGKDVDEKLNEVFAVAAPVAKEVEKPKYKIASDLNGEEADTDFQYARENLYNVIERGSDAMEGILEVARETEHPRAYEVVGQLIDKITNANKELLDVHNKMKNIRDDGSSHAPQNVTNALFVGSTAELQKMLKQNNKGANK